MCLISAPLHRWAPEFEEPLVEADCPLRWVFSMHRVAKCLGFAISSNDLGCSTHIQVLYKLLQQNFFQFRISQWILCFSFFNFSTDTFCEWHGYKRPSSACPHILFFLPVYVYICSCFMCKFITGNRYFCTAICHMQSTGTVRQSKECFCVAFATIRLAVLECEHTVREMKGRKRTSW